MSRAATTITNTFDYSVCYGSIHLYRPDGFILLHPACNAENFSAFFMLYCLPEYAVERKNRFNRRTIRLAAHKETLSKHGRVSALPEEGGFFRFNYDILTTILLHLIPTERNTYPLMLLSPNLVSSEQEKLERISDALHQIPPYSADKKTDQMMIAQNIFERDDQCMGDTYEARLFSAAFMKSDLALMAFLSQSKHFADFFRVNTLIFYQGYWCRSFDENGVANVATTNATELEHIETLLIKHIAKNISGAIIEQLSQLNPTLINFIDLVSHEGLLSLFFNELCAWHWEYFVTYPVGRICFLRNLWYFAAQNTLPTIIAMLNADNQVHLDNVIYCLTKYDCSSVLPVLSLSATAFLTHPVGSWCALLRNATERLYLIYLKGLLGISLDALLRLNPSILEYPRAAYLLINEGDFTLDQLNTMEPTLLLEKLQDPESVIIIKRIGKIIQLDLDGKLYPMIRKCWKETRKWNIEPRESFWCSTFPTSSEKVYRRIQDVIRHNPPSAHRALSVWSIMLDFFDTSDAPFTRSLNCAFNFRAIPEDAFHKALTEAKKTIVLPVVQEAFSEFQSWCRQKF
ncbi:MAG: hypothetical protein A3E84_03555 [Gammaproteobacteria bacterium RIFCSPHIGHO2_12_FULL_42_13]|nr:MAG: hypothetical protein A3E84_03555 [Gammaproteobacteria bacterium RIFCSPHIGHO2_12_FULL_42_13]